MSGLFGFSFGSKKATSSAQNWVWQPQATGLQNLYGSADQLAAQQTAAMPGIQNYFTGLQNTALPAFNALAAGPQNPWLQGMADTAMGSVARNFNANILPGIQGEANAAGQYGGARQGLLQDFAGGEAVRAMGDVANNIYGSAWQSGLGAQQNALAMLPNMANLGMGGMQAQWLPLQQQRDIYGNPIILGTQSSKDTGINTQFSMGGLG